MQDRFANGGEDGDKLAGLGQSQAVLVKDRLAKDLHQVDDEPDVAPGREFLEVELKELGQREQSARIQDCRSCSIKLKELGEMSSILAS